MVPFETTLYLFLYFCYWLVQLSYLAAKKVHKMDDDSLLVPENDAVEDHEYDRLKGKEIKDTFLKLGITQIVFGILLIVGGIVIACTWPDWGADRYGEGIWCGIFVVICGAMAITARFYLHIAVVITSLIINILTAVLLTSGVIIAGISTFSHTYRYEVGNYCKFAALNLGLTATLVLSIYLSVVFGKVLSEKRQYCCIGQAPEGYPGYSMVYVPPGTQAETNPVGAFMAVPGKSTVPSHVKG